jgi:hypothetical protein
MLVVVAADEHPDLDDWVWQQAHAEAARNSRRIDTYQGREDTLPPPVPADMCCHVFTTTREEP